MSYPDDRKYSKDHEWIMIDGATVTVGVTEYAAEQLGDIVYVELPQQGDDFAKGETFGVLESVKAVSDCFVPISGTIAETNDSLADSPEVINEDAHGEGWMVKINMSDPDELEDLLDHEAYEEFVKEETS
jgi:glycine cleavage system H protein